MNRLTLSIILGFVSAAASLAGSLIVLRTKKITKNFLFYFIALGSGFILAASIFDMIPKTLEIAPRAVVYIMLGFFIIHIFEHVFSSHFHFGEEVHKDEIQKSTAWSILLALTIHSFLDGVSVSAGLSINFLLGITIFTAVILHKMTDGFTITSVMLASGREKAGALAASLIISFSTLAGSFWAAIYTVYSPVLLALSAGAFLYLSATDLIPEIIKQRKLKFSLTIILGVVLYYITRVILGRFGIV